MHAEAESINNTRWCVATSEPRLGMRCWLTSSQHVSKFKDSGSCPETVRRWRAAAWKAADTTRQSAGWKVAVAAHLKATTDVSNGWLAERLEMGSPTYVSKHVGLLRRGVGAGRPWFERLQKVKGTGVVPKSSG